MASLDEQLHILRRGVDQIVPEDEFRRKLDRSLREKRPLRVKYGIDPDVFNALGRMDDGTNLHADPDNIN